MMATTKRWTAAVLLIAGSAHAAAEHQIPLRMHHGYAVVEARLDGHHQPIRLIVDTAASVTALDEALAERLDIVDTGTQAAKVTGANGAALDVRFAEITDFELAGKQYKLKPLLTSMARFSHDGAPSDAYHGILGNDLLRHFDVRFDVPAGLLVLSAPSGLDAEAYERPQCQINGFAANRPQHLTGFGMIDIGANASGKQASVRAVVDTGGAQSVFNWAAIEALGFERTDDRLRKRARGTFGFGEQESETYLAVLDKFMYADWQVPNLEVRVTDLSVFQALGMGDGPAIILGIDVLQQLPLTMTRGVTHICLG